MRLESIICGLIFAIAPAIVSAKTITVQVGVEVTNGGGGGPYGGGNSSFAFSPATVMINAGDTVQWTWTTNDHSTTSGSCATGSCIPDGKWDSGVQNAPHTFSHIFTTAGTFPYYCRIHGITQGMRGTVIVVQPDYSISVLNTMAGPIFPNQTATFNGTLSTQDGFSNAVNLSCGSGAPSTCSLSPASITPSSSGTPFTITAGSQATGSFQFAAQAVGTDFAQTKHSSQTLTLGVVDFALGALSDMTISSNGTSPAQPFMLSGSGGFTGALTLACSGVPAGSALPAGVSCNFSPNPVNLSATNASSAVSLTMSTDHTLQGVYPIAITATTSSIANAPTHSGTFLLTVQGDYQLSISNSPAPVFPGQGGTFSGTITPLDGYTGTVTIGCGPFDPTNNSISCLAPSAPIVVSNVTPVNFSVSFSTNANGQTTAPQDYAGNISGADTIGHVHTPSVTVRVVDFSLSVPNPATVSVAQGNPSLPIALTVSALGQFNSPVTLSCSSGLPSATSCFFSPSATLEFGPGSPATVNLVMNSGGAAVSAGNLVTITATVPPPAAANTVHVLVGDLVSNYYSSYPTFGPSGVTVNPSDTVEWDWADSGHTSTSGLCCTPDGNWDSGVTPLDQGATFSHTFPTSGSFPYFCRVHGPVGMVGTVQVNALPPERKQQLTLNITGGNGTTNLAVATAHSVKIPAKPDPAPVGGTVEFTTTVSQSGNTPANPSLFVAFSEPVNILSSLPSGCSAVAGGISCAITSFPAAPFVFDVVVPFSRSVTAQAFIRSDAANSGSPVEAFETVQVRPRPLSRNGLPPTKP